MVLFWSGTVPQSIVDFIVTDDITSSKSIILYCNFVTLAENVIDFPRDILNPPDGVSCPFPIFPTHAPSVASPTVFNPALEPLLQLYAAWKDQWKGFDVSLGPCRWGVMSGVTCDANGVVTGLDVSGKGLRGTIPSAIGALTGLRELNLASNYLTGEQDAV